MAESAAYIPRHVESRIKTAIEDTRIVAVVGPRQSGKTTLVRQMASADRRPYLTLDDVERRQFAKDDPDGFLRDYDSVVIDEIQRAPELLLTIKKIVDADPRPGRFLITGSVDLLQKSVSPDSLAGRVETVELMPFSQAEISRLAPARFIERLLSCDFPALETVGRTENLVERVLCGGYPEALQRDDDRRRVRWLQSYVGTLLNHDLPDLWRVNKPMVLAPLVDLCATSSGQLVNLSGFASQLGIDAKTSDRCLSLLEHMFLIRRVRGWHRSERRRLAKAPKLHFLDAGLLAAISGITASAIQWDRKCFGTLLECFVFSEILKAAELQDDGLTFSHYRDKDKAEVDLVLEQSSGEVVGVEVKSRATVRPSDFKGLKRLQESCGQRFACGVVFHDGETIRRVYPKMFAMPFKMLWDA